MTGGWAELFLVDEECVAADGLLCACCSGSTALATSPASLEPASKYEQPRRVTLVQGEGACTWRAWRVGVQVVCERPLIGSTSACACVQTGRGGGVVARTSLPAPLHHRRTVARGWRGWCPLPSYHLRRCAVLYGIQYVYTINRLLRIQIVLCSYGIVRCVLGTPTRGYAAH